MYMLLLSRVTFIIFSVAISVYFALAWFLYGWFYVYYDWDAPVSHHVIYIGSAMQNSFFTGVATFVMYNGVKLTGYQLLIDHFIGFPHNFNFADFFL